MIWVNKVFRFVIGIVVVGAIIGVFGSHSGGANQPHAGSQTKPDETAKKVDNAKTKQVVAEARKTQLAELQALGDWDISSSKQEFEHDYASIEKSLNQGDVYGAYETAKRAAEKADQWNTDTMDNQDIKNVPADIPQNVRDVLSNVDPNLAEAYMDERLGFEKLADAINSNDLSKVDDAKSYFQLADSSFANAKAFIDRAQNMLK
jgi:hypothetical protein